MSDSLKPKIDNAKNASQKIGDDFLIEDSEKERGVENSFLKKGEKDADTIWLSVSEAANIGGVQTKTIRRAIKSKTVKFKIVKNRYLINCYSLLVFLHSNTKLQNKLNQIGIGKYVAQFDL